MFDGTGTKKAALGFRKRDLVWLLSPRGYHEGDQGLGKSMRVHVASCTAACTSSSG